VQDPCGLANTDRLTEHGIAAIVQVEPSHASRYLATILTP
jgi:hypothetical protein